MRKLAEDFITLKRNHMYMIEHFNLFLIDKKCQSLGLNYSIVNKTFQEQYLLSFLGHVSSDQKSGIDYEKAQNLYIFLADSKMLRLTEGFSIPDRTQFKTNLYHKLKNIIIAYNIEIFDLQYDYFIKVYEHDY